jgi:hypothetical protein
MNGNLINETQIQINFPTKIIIKIEFLVLFAFFFIYASEQTKRNKAHDF